MFYESVMEFELRSVGSVLPRNEVTCLSTAANHLSTEKPAPEACFRTWRVMFTGIGTSTTGRSELF